MIQGGRLGYSLGPLLSTNEVLTAAKMADDAVSTHSIWVPESWGRESFATLGAASQVTNRCLLGTSIVSIFSRTPATVAMGAATLDILSSGRTIIGLGASTEAIVANWHGVKFERPLERMREFVDLVRTMTAGERVTYDGNFFKVSNFKLLHKPFRMKIPIYLGAVNKGMVSLAGEVGDGVILYLRPLEELKETASKLRRLTSGRPFEIACSIICAVSDEHPERARTRSAQTLAFYVAVGTYYKKFLAQNGFDQEVRKIGEAYSSGGVELAAKAVPVQMLHSLTVCGTREECKKGLSKFLEAGVTLPIIQFNPVDSTESSFRELLSTF